MGKIYQKMYLTKKSRSKSVLGGFICNVILRSFYSESRSFSIKRAGFTLIELLVVVLIIGILAAVAMPQYQTAVDKARYAQLMSNVNAVLKAQQIYYMANGRYASSFEELDGGLLPAGYVISQRTLVSPGKDIHIALGGFGTGTTPTYLYSLDTRSYSGYLKYLPDSQARCYAYVEGGERAERVCRSMTGRKTYTVWEERAKIYAF